MRIFLGMTATLDLVERKVAQFNELCFGGVLPPIPVKLTRAGTFLGKVTCTKTRSLFGNVTGCSDFTLRISTSFDLTERELEDVVIHELIHYYIAYRNIRDSSSHGPVFRKMMDEINREYGRNVTVRHRGDGRALPKSRTSYFCVSQMQDGAWGITVCATTRVLQIHRALPRHFRLRSMAWYESTDPFFSRYPRSRTPKIYRISESDLDAHLPGAVPYTCNGRKFVPSGPER